MPVRPYEVVYIIDPDVNEENTGALVERFRALAVAQGAEDLRVDTQMLGRRRLAYEIDHKREGQYVIMDFQSEAKAPDEVERVLNITEGVLRSMVIRLDEMPPEPVVPAPAPAPVAAAPVPEAAPEAAPAPEVTEEAEATEAAQAGATEAPEEATEEATEEMAVPTPLPDTDTQSQELTNATETDQPEADQPEADQPEA